MSLRIWLEGHPPGANELQRMNRYAVGRSRAEWKAWARMLALDAANRSRLPAGELPWERAHVHVTHHYRVRRTRDLDNLTAGLKGVIDGMVGVLYRADDSDHLRLTSEVVIGSRDGIAVTITPLDSGPSSEGTPPATS